MLAIPRTGDESPGMTNGALVVLGLADGEVAPVAQAAVASFLSVALTH